MAAAAYPNSNRRNALSLLYVLMFTLVLRNVFFKVSREIDK